MVTSWRSTRKSPIDVGTASMENLKLAVTIADRLLVPVPPSQADIWSTQRFLRFVDSVVGKRKPEILGSSTVPTPIMRSASRI